MAASTDAGEGLFSCTICYEPSGTYSTSTLCGHIFHDACITRWLKNPISPNLCPNCRCPSYEHELVKLHPSGNERFTVKTKEELDSFKKLLNLRLILNKIYKIKVEELTSKLNTSEESLKKSCIAVDNVINDLFSYQLNGKKDIPHLYTKSADYKFNEEQNKRILLQKEVYLYQARHSAELNQLKSEIEKLKSKKAGIQSIYHDYKQQSTSSQNAGSKFVLPRQIQSPKLQPSPYGFLSNCHFWVVDELRKVAGATNHLYFDEHRVMEHGGTVAYHYTNMVTHIIGNSQNNLEVLKGLNERKKCVTDYWLSDVIGEGKLLKPWLAHHFPIPYSEDKLPYEHKQIAIVNFQLNEYHKIKAMVEVTGATVINKISRNTFIVVTLKSEGEMIKKAVSLKIPVVNVRWITDILLGENIGLQHFKRKKYQQFDLPNPYQINYTKVSHLLAAWKKRPKVIKLNSPSKRINKSTMTNIKMKTCVIQEFLPSGVNNGDGHNITSTTSILAIPMATEPSMSSGQATRQAKKAKKVNKLK
ncbi:PAX-interacting protein 1-like [Metopolophium dirhodum]|uniref:PAX-interacting protein 1-like n=1 Tax=Metopolophium dirhodum TaxID=44670 RepID=UPI0029906249|nr:PAX-interacting protein 1-like [Metopolophium dirhodum]